MFDPQKRHVITTLSRSFFVFLSFNCAVYRKKLMLDVRMSISPNADVQNLRESHWSCETRGSRMRTITCAPVEFAYNRQYNSHPPHTTRSFSSDT